MGFSEIGRQRGGGLGEGQVGLGRRADGTAGREMGRLARGLRRGRV